MEVKEDGGGHFGVSDDAALSLTLSEKPDWDEGNIFNNISKLSMHHIPLASVVPTSHMS